MMQLTREELVQLVAAVVEQTRRGDGCGRTLGRRILDEKLFRRVDKFSGSDQAWQDWSFKFRAVVRGASGDALAVMSWAEKATGDPTVEEFETQNVDD